MAFSYAAGDSSATKAAISAGVGGKPCKS